MAGDVLDVVVDAVVGAGDSGKMTWRICVLFEHQCLVSGATEVNWDDFVRFIVSASKLASCMWSSRSPFPFPSSAEESRQHPAWGLPPRTNGLG